jgi:hypothetical protein
MGENMKKGDQTMKNKNIKWMKKRTFHRPVVSKTRLKQTLVLSIILMTVTTLFGLVPPIYVTLGEGKYITLGENDEGNTEWIAAGSEENYLAGRFFKIDRHSHDSGEPASAFEVIPTGFPVSCGFTEEFWKGEFGFYAPNWMIVIDYLFWLALSAGIVFAFYPRVKTRVQGRKKAKKGHAKRLFS